MGVGLVTRYKGRELNGGGRGGHNALPTVEADMKIPSAVVSAEGYLMLGGLNAH